MRLLEHNSSKPEFSQLRVSLNMMSTRLVVLVLAAGICATSAASIPTSSEKPSTEDLRYMTYLERQCLRKTGTTATYEQLVTAFAFYPMCFDGHVSLGEMADDLGALNSQNRVRIFDKYCPQMNGSLTCLNPIADTLRKCWEGEELTILNVVINLFPEALNLLCKDHGEIFFKLDDPDYQRCMDKFGEYANDCADKMTKTKDINALSELNEAQCREITDARECISNKLNSCRAAGLMDLFDLFYKPIVRGTPCRQFINVDEHNAVETNVV